MAPGHRRTAAARRPAPRAALAPPAGRRRCGAAVAAWRRASSCSAAPRTGFPPRPSPYGAGLRRARQGPGPLRPRRAHAASRRPSTRRPRSSSCRPCATLVVWSRGRPCSAASLGRDQILALWAARGLRCSSAARSPRAAIRGARRRSTAACSSATRDAASTPSARSASAHGADACVVAAVTLGRARTTSASRPRRLHAIVDRTTSTACHRRRRGRPGRAARPRPRGQGARACGSALLPRMLEVVGSSVEFDDVEGVTLLGVRRFGLTRSSRLVKRAFDLRRRDGSASSRSRRSWPSIAVADQARLAAARCSSASTRVGRDGQPLRDAQVPHDGRRTPTRRKAGAARPQRGRRPLQDRRRPADHARRARSCAAPRSTSCRSCSTSCAAR